MSVTLEIVYGNIVEREVAAVVNAANTSLLRGGGVCDAIFEAAGDAKLTRACSQFNGCPTGCAKITPGFALNADHIIHAVGPRWFNGKNGEVEALRMTYRASLELAARHNLKSITFPAISTGIYGFPLKLAVPNALGVVYGCIMEWEWFDLIEFIVFDQKDVLIFEKAFAALCRKHPGIVEVVSSTKLIVDDMVIPF